MAALTLTLGTLLGWHVYLIIRNMTTIEVNCDIWKMEVELLFWEYLLIHSWTWIFCQYYEAIRTGWLARKSGQSYRHPYNLSVYKNIVSVSLLLFFFFLSFVFVFACVSCMFLFLVIYSIVKKRLTLLSFCLLIRSWVQTWWNGYGL